MGGRSISEIADLDFTGLVPAVDLSDSELASEEYDFPSSISGSGLHSSDLFAPYSVFLPSIDSNRERNEEQMKLGGSVMSQDKIGEDIASKNKSLTDQIDAEYNRLKSQMDVEATVQWLDGKTETFDVNLRPSVKSSEIMTMPSLVVLDSQNSRRQMALREWRPISDQLLSDIETQNNSLKLTQHDYEAHRSFGTDEFDPEDFTESILAMDEKQLQAALNGQEGVYTEFKDKKHFTPVTPSEIALADTDGQKAYALRPWMPNIYEGAIHPERTGEDFGNYYANMANLGLLNFFDRKHEFYRDAWPDESDSFITFVDNEMIVYTRDEMHFFGGQDYQDMRDNLFKIALEPDDYEQLGLSKDDIYRQGPDWDIEQATDLVHKWKDTYREAYEELPDIELLDYVPQGFDPEIFSKEKRIETRV